MTKRNPSNVTEISSQIQNTRISNRLNYVILVSLKQLKNAVSEKMTKISLIDEEAGEVKIEKQDESGLRLKTLSITMEQKCANTFVRLNSINVELIDDELEFVRYVIDFAIDFATNDMVNVGESGYLKLKLAHMLNINENDKRLIAAVEIIDRLIDDVVGADRAGHKGNDREEENEKPAENGNDADEFFYDPTDLKKVHIPPMWTPSNKRANAALIYLFFRDVS